MAWHILLLAGGFFSLFASLFIAVSNWDGDRSKARCAWFAFALGALSFSIGLALI